MATTTLSLSSLVDKKNGKSEVLIRFRCGTLAQRVKSRTYIYPEFFDNDNHEIVIKQRIITPRVKEMVKAKAQVELICNKLLDTFANTPRETIKRGWAQDVVDKTLDRTSAEPVKKDFVEYMKDFLEEEKLSIGRKRHYQVLLRLLERYELYSGTDLSLDDLTSKDLDDIRDFMRDEHTLFTTDDEGKRVPKPGYKEIYESMPAGRYPKERGRNFIFTYMKNLRAVFSWCIDKGYTSNDPFKKFDMGGENYGTPIYITIAERNQIFNTDLSAQPELAKQRDVFVFQCLVGCRVGDLYRLTKDNLHKDKYGLAVEYVPQKTLATKADTVKVYLHDDAKKIITRYKNKLPGKKAILPLISQQNYNYSIKKVFTACGITRNVAVLNPVTQRVEMRPISEVASSHMARRTFIGNLYKQVKDPNLVGKLSGHAEGSRAFARYRDIDDEMISDMTKLL